MSDFDIFVELRCEAFRTGTYPDEMPYFDRLSRACRDIWNEHGLDAAAASAVAQEYIPTVTLGRGAQK